MPRTASDAEIAVALFGAGAGGVGPGDDVRYAWVVEALLDELGVLEWGEDGERRKGGDGEEEEGEHVCVPASRMNREQRWAAVDLCGGVVVVDAFLGGAVAKSRGDRGAVRVVGGFGGPRV